MYEKFITKKYPYMGNNKKTFLFLNCDLIMKKELIEKFVNFLKFKNKKVFTLKEFINLDYLYYENKIIISVFLGSYLAKQKGIIKKRMSYGYKYYLLDGYSFDNLFDSFDSP